MHNPHRLVWKPDILVTLPCDVSLSHVSELMEAHPERVREKSVIIHFSAALFPLGIPKAMKAILLNQSEEVHQLRR